MLKKGIPVAYVAFMKMWLEGRNVYVADGGQKPTILEALQGLPQGSVLCP